MNAEDITFQVNPGDPTSLVIFVGESRWELRAVARVLQELLDWYHANESFSVADRDNLPSREMELEQAQLADQALYTAIDNLVYEDGENGLS